MRCGLLPPTRYDFYPRPPRGGRPGQRHCADHLQNFYPRPPRGGRPCSCRRRVPPAGISIHALREEGDALQPSLAGASFYFYPRPPRGGRRSFSRRTLGFFVFLSTPSARRATLRRTRSCTLPKNFYPRPPRGGRHDGLSRAVMFQLISIHALREEGDLGRGSSKQSMANFYPRPPRGGRQFFPVLPEQSIGFLSTPSARRATLCGRIRNQKDIRFLSTPSARRATPAQ